LEGVRLVHGFALGAINVSIFAAMSVSVPKSSTLSKLPGRIYLHPTSGEELLITTPSFRQGNASFLKSRGLQLLNALAAMKVQVLGSFWLPGMHVYTSDEIKGIPSIHGLVKTSLFVGTTSEPVLENNWYSFKGDPLMVVENCWENVDQYVDSLKKKYRARYRKAMELAATVETFYVDSHSDFEDCCEMFQHTLAPKVAALPQDLSLLLEGFGSWFGEDYKVLAAKQDGRIIGFIGYLSDGEVLRAMHYGAAGDAPNGLYSLLMFKVIHRGIEGGFKEINLGRTATEIKSTYGAVARENYFSFYTTKPLLKLVLRIAKKKYQPKEYILRSALK
jgi:predicted N-acyltransferase